MGRNLANLVKRLGQLGRAASLSARRSPKTASRSGRQTIDTAWDPHPDGRPDPGEVVWTWVPYEDDPSQGKDRPVLIIGRIDEQQLIALQLSSQDHDRDARQEARAGRHWLDIGTGAWDHRGRPSEVRLNRVITVRERDVRREGAVLARERYNAVIAAARQYLP